VAQEAAVRFRSLALLLFGLFAASSAAPARANDVHALHYDLRLDLPLTIGAGTLWITSELLKSKLAPTHCRWCDDNALDRGVRDELRWDHAKAADRTSNWLAFGVMPALSLGGMLALGAAQDSWRTGAIDALIVLEATALSANLNQIVKLLVGRERPFVHALSADQKAHTDHPADNNLSFYSGHTSPAFALAVAAGTVATLRGYRAAPAVWAVGLPLAAFTGYLRIAADKHYLTDVLTGAVLGSSVGFLVPFFLHGRRTSSATPNVSMGTTAPQLTLSWTH
jgi:membrane-associated phospholipid phosphatase